MAFFIPYSIQKRLLRYVLSNLELLDTDTLDLDRLDIGWGRRSTVELRDIALRKDKLASLLQLPASFRVSSAVLACLRVTIPSDLYTSSIEIEALGTSISINFVDWPTEEQAQDRHRRDQRATDSKSASSKPPSKSGNGRYEKAVGRGDEALPTPQDLAKSFLEQEPEDEKEYLETELNTRSINLQHSVTSSEADSESPGYGAGQGFGLPSFLAGFIAGVGERLKLTIRDLKLEVHSTLDLQKAGFNGDKTERLTPLSILISVESLKSMSIDDRSTSLEASGPNSTYPPRRGPPERKFALSGLRSTLISESIIFEEWTALFRNADASPAHASPTNSWPADYQPVEKRSAFSNALRSSLAYGVPDGYESLGRMSRAEEESFMSSHVQDNRGNSEIPTHEYGAHQRPPMYPQARALTLRSSGQGEQSDSTQSDGFWGELTPEAPRNLKHSSTQQTYGSRPTSPNSTSTSRDRHSNPDMRSGLDSPAEDLTESHLFSHDEAQSLYLSAIDEPPLQHRSLPHVPGAWDHASSDPDNMYEVNMEYEEVKTSDRRSPPRKSHTRNASTQSMLGRQSREIDEPAQVDEDESPLQSPYDAPNRTYTHKDLFAIDKIELLIPGNSEHREVLAARHVEDSTHDVGQRPIRRSSTSQKAVPGSFTTSQSKIPSTSVEHHSAARDESESTIKLSIGTVSGDIDFTACAVILQSAGRILDKYNAVPTSAPRSGVNYSPEGSNPKLETRVQVSNINIALGGSLNAESGANADGKPESPVAERSNLRKIFLLVQAKGIDACLIQSKAVRSCSIDIEDLSIESKEHLRLSFLQQAELNQSAQNMHHTQRKAFSMSLDLTARYLTIKTLPVSIQADIQKMDESVNSLGGLSVLLEVGSSTLSETIHRSRAGRDNRSSTPVKTVRFEAQAIRSCNLPRDDEPTKLNIRIGGVLMGIKTRVCDLGLKTSAMKIVARRDIFGVQIDEIRLNGPTGPRFDEDLASTITLQNFGLKYIYVPEELDLSRLISLLTPSKDKFAEEDDILVDTLIKQRRRGAVARASISQVRINLVDINTLKTLKELRGDVSRLTSITKYLPQDSRPGLLSLVFLRDISLSLRNLPRLGTLSAELSSTEFAHVGSPSLFALGIQRVAVTRNGRESLLHQVTQCNTSPSSFMVMARFIGDEIDPTVKLKLFNTCLEYDVKMVMEAMGLSEDVELSDLSESLIKSMKVIFGAKPPVGSDVQGAGDDNRIDVQLRDCAVGLKPQKCPAKALLILTKAHLKGSTSIKPDAPLEFSFNKGAICLTNDAALLTSTYQDQTLQHDDLPNARGQVEELCHAGYVTVSWISAAELKITDYAPTGSGPACFKFAVQDALIVLETCADSTQTLAELMGSLQLPMPPSVVAKYQTETAPLEHIMASFTGDAFATDVQTTDRALEDSISEEDLQAASEDFECSSEDLRGGRPDLMDGSSLLISPSKTPELGLGHRSRESSRPDAQHRLAGNTSPGVRAKTMPRQTQAMALKWDSTRNQYASVSTSEAMSGPYALALENVHLIWNLHDGYDWTNTREAIQKAVREVEEKSEARRKRRRSSAADDEDDESVIGDFLFNSIYIGVQTNHEPRDLTKCINQDLADHLSDTASLASAATKRTSYGSKHAPSSKRKLRLERSARHKLTIELRGVCCDTFVFAPGTETASSTNLRIHNLDIFDHVPTSTWKKFATYLVDAGPREDRKPMVHLELCDVKPVPTLAASELVIRATILPLRLHVDQDTLDFVTRFFDFNNESSSLNSPKSEQTYIQRIEVRPVPIKLDYKPKKVDYSGLRSGRTKEFMNFFTLDGADMVLKHVILYGCPSFSKLHESLEDIWMPDIKRNQLPGILSGLNGMRTLVNVGAGVRNLVVVPINEYQKDGRLVRSVAKGASLFARTTSSEITKFGARLAIGAQNALQGAEGLLSGPRETQESDWEALDADDANSPRALSNYADQPLGILQGLKGAAKSLERDLLVTRDVIIAVSAEARESGSFEGTARAVARHAPTMILRPMIGASKAISQTLLGAANTADPQNRRRLEDKYKRY